MITILSFLAPLFVIFSSTAFLARLLKKDFGKVLPFYLMSISLVMYLFMLFGQMMLGFWCLVAFSFALPIWIIYNILGKKYSLHDELGNLFSSSAKIFVIIYAIIFGLNFFRGFRMWDDFMHWGMMVKEILRLRDFYNVPGSILQIHVDYPPIMSIYESFWCLLSGGYAEHVLFNSVQILGLSFILPFVGNLRWEKGKKFNWRLIGLLAAIFALPIMINLEDDRFYYTIYTDSIIALSLGFCLAMITYCKRYNRNFVVGLAITLCFLVMIKQICLVFVAMILVYLICMLTIRNRGNIGKYLAGNWKGLLVATILIVASIGGYYISWSQRVAESGFVGQFSISNLLQSIKDIALGDSKLTEIQITTLKNFGEAFVLEQPIVLGLPYLQMMILFPVAVIMIGRKFKKYISKKEYICFIVIGEIGAAGYAFLMLLLYLFSFGDIEGPRLASYLRYLSTYWLALYFAIGVGLLHIYASTKITHRPALFWRIAIIMVLIATPVTLIKILPFKTTAAEMVTESEFIRRNITDDGRVYMINQGGDSYPHIMMQYLVHPVYINNAYQSASIFSLGDKYGPDDVYTVDVPVDEWRAMVQNFEYLYLYHIDQQFIDKYGAVFDETPSSGQLYRVADGSLILMDQM